MPDEIISTTEKPGTKKQTTITSKKLTKTGTIKKPATAVSKKPAPAVSATSAKTKPSLVTETSGEPVNKITITQGQKLLFVSPKFSGSVYGRGRDIIHKQTPWELVGGKYPGLDLGEEEVHLDGGNDEKKSMEKIEKSIDEGNMGALVIFTYKASPNQKRFVDNIANIAKK